MKADGQGFRGRLPFRQSALAMVIAVALGIVSSAGLIGYELYKARETTEDMLRGVLGALAAPATQAAYNLNRDTATSVVEALSRFPLVTHAVVYDNFGTVLAERRLPAKAPAFATLGDWLFDREQAFALDLVAADLDRPVGRLVIHADTSTAASGVVKTGALILGIGIIHNLLLAAVLAFAFFLTLTRPLMSLWRMVKGVNPAAWPEGAITTPGTQRRDEIGELAVAMQHFMELARDQQRHAEREIQVRLGVEAVLREREARIRRLMESNIIGVFFWDLAGRVTMANDAFLAIIGYDRADVMAGRMSWADMTPTEYRDLDLRNIDELKLHRTCKPFEKEFVRRDGTRVPVLMGGAFFDDSADEGVGFVLDLTERRQAEERQRLLIDELNHRVKNTLATVQALVTQTFRTAPTPEAFRTALDARLLALSQTHNLLNRSAWTGARLDELVRDVLAPFAGGTTAQVTIAGEEVCIAPNAAVTLGMVFHELTTNAAKYGALSRQTGRISVAWAVVGDGDRRRLRLEWTEEGGPPVGEPQRKGMGRQLIEHGLARQLGDVRLAFPAEGVRCLMELPWGRVKGEP